MGRLDFQRLLSEVRNTPAYQLMLAGFDIAEFIVLVSDLEDPIVLSRFISLAQRIPSNFGSRGIFFVPNSILADAGPALEELIANTKVCQATATIGEAPAVAKYYLPDATPIEFPVEPARRPGSSGKGFATTIMLSADLMAQKGTR